MRTAPCFQSGGHWSPVSGSKIELCLKPYRADAVFRGQVDSGHDLVSEGILFGHEPVHRLHLAREDVRDVDRRSTIDNIDLSGGEGLKSDDGSAPRTGQAHHAPDILATPPLALPDERELQMILFVSMYLGNMSYETSFTWPKIDS